MLHIKKHNFIFYFYFIFLIFFLFELNFTTIWKCIKSWSILLVTQHIELIFILNCIYFQQMQLELYTFRKQWSNIREEKNRLNKFQLHKFQCSQRKNRIACKMCCTFDCSFKKKKKKMIFVENTDERKRKENQEWKLTQCAKLPINNILDN